MATGASKDLVRLALAGGAFLGLACSHTDPFSTPPYGTTQPFDPAPPVRLTFNEAADRGASWLPDGSGILYSSRQEGRRDGDVCLAELPPTGGSQRRLVCDLTPGGVDSTNAIEWPVVGPGGRLAFVKASGARRAVSPIQQAVAIASGLDPSSSADAQPIPYTIPGEPRHSAVTQLRWLPDGRLIFVGGQVVYRAPGVGLPLDTLVSGLKLVVLDPVTPSAGPAVLPGTDFATGVTPGLSSDEIFYTVGGDTRVFRLVLSSGEVSVLHDFGTAGIARDLHLAGSRLAAIVGGRVAFSADPDLGQLQWDSGGIVHVLDLSSGADLALEGPGLFRRPALAPSADRVVAEGYPLIITQAPNQPVADTTVARSGDLYLFDLP
jgi:WD40 repeat protein